MQKRTFLLLRVFLFLLTSFHATLFWAQGLMDVETFKRIDNDLRAQMSERHTDDDGEPCALIIIETPLKKIKFTPDGRGIVRRENHPGEIWLFVPYGARHLYINHEDYYPVRYEYQLPIERGIVYRLRLKTYASGESHANTNQQLLVIHPEPKNATVYVDDQEIEVRDGSVALMMPKGEHHFRVEADEYEAQDGIVTLAEQMVSKTIVLRPQFATFQLFTLPDNGFDIFVNGEHVGTSPYKSGHLVPGEYKVHIEKKKYYSVDTLLRLRKGEVADLTCKLTSYADSLFYNRELGGHRLSFGINAGYAMPFVTSSAGGGFTGSPINYSLGDSRENVHYTSQSGFTAGVLLDYKLYKNLYLMLGANYSQYKWSNSFNETIKGVFVASYADEANIGDQMSNIKEDYTYCSIDIPLLLSYRIVLSKTGCLHFHVGPYFAYGLSSKMKLSGSADIDGMTYGLRGNGSIDYSAAFGSFVYSEHYRGNLDLYSSTMQYTITVESGVDMSDDHISTYKFQESPYKKINYGLKLGVGYELRGFLLNLNYNLQLSNMANQAYWEGPRIPLFLNSMGINHMSGYRHRVHGIELKLGYIFRY